MSRILAIAVVAAAAMTFGNSQLAAQDLGGVGGGYNFGYGFGLGRDIGRDFDRGFGFNRFNRFGFNRFAGRIHHRIEQPPYFALYPPVYYSSQIVRRPMGVSPFAAPPGIVPVEMMQPAKAETVINPYFRPKTMEANHDTDKSETIKKGT